MMIVLAVDTHYIVSRISPQEKYGDLNWVNWDLNLFSAKHSSQPIHFMDYLLMTAGIMPHYQLSTIM